MKLYSMILPTLTLATNLLATNSGSYPIEVLETHSQPFERGGVLEIDGSFGALIIEGWSSPTVKLKLEKRTSQSYPLSDHDEIKLELDRTLVAFRKSGIKGLRMETRLAGFHLWKRPLQGKTNLQLTYHLMVPRDTRLIIRHDVGLVKIREITGHLDVSNRIGELDVSLPDSHDSSIYARARIGEVKSDFHPEARRKFLLGAELRDDAGSSSKRVELRIGIGAIKISKQKPEEI